MTCCRRIRAMPRHGDGCSRTAWSYTSCAPIPTPFGWAGRAFPGDPQPPCTPKRWPSTAKSVFIGSFNLDPRSAVINTEAGLYIKSPELAKRLLAYMETGVLPANSYRVRLDSNGKMVWETVRDGTTVRCRGEPEAGFRRRFVAGLWKLLPINSQL